MLLVPVPGARVVGGILIVGGLIVGIVDIGPWDGASDISNPEIAGDEAADEILDDEICPPGNGDNCEKVRRECRQRCINKWSDNALGGIPQNQASEWTRRCRAACTAKFGCGPDAF